MNINQLRTPEGLNNYLNEVVKTLAVKLPDFMLKMFLWQKVKFDFLNSNEQIENLYEENEKHLLVIKTNEVNTKLLIGYLHIPDDLHHNTPNISNEIADKANKIVNVFNTLKTQNSWSDSQIFIISTFRISNYNKIDLSLLPNYVKYFFLTDSADYVPKYYEIAVDNATNEFMEGDLLLKDLLKLRKI
jgi:hypothetical protein